MVLSVDLTHQIIKSKCQPSHTDTIILPDLFTVLSESVYLLVLNVFVLMAPHFFPLFTTHISYFVSKNANFFVTKGFLPILLCKLFCQITWRVSLDRNVQVIPHISGLGSGWGVCQCQLYFTFKSFRHFVLRDLGHGPGKKCLLTLNVNRVLTKTGCPEGFACVWFLPLHCFFFPMCWCV